MGVVVFTGTLTKWTRKEATAAAEASGYTVGGSITAATTILVYGEKAGKKLEDAKKKGLEVFTEGEWEAKLNTHEGDDDEPMEDQGEQEADGAEEGEEEDEAMEEDEPVDKKDDVVVFTGTLTTQSRKEAVANAEAHGYTVGSSVTKATTILVCGEKAGKKADDARKKGIQIFTEDEWTEHLNGGTEEEDRNAAKTSRTPVVAAAPAKAAKTGAKRKAEPTDVAQQVVVFTGALVNHSRKEATQLAEAKGFRVEPRLTKATTILVCGDRAGQKKSDAEKQGVMTLTEDDWQAKLDGMEQEEAESSASPRPTKKAATSPSPTSDGEVDYDSETGAINGISPKTLIADGTLLDVKSASSNSTYVVKRLGSTYTCNCPAWRNQRVAPTSRTCKHLKQILGDSYEAARAATGSTATAEGSTLKAPSKKAAVVKSSAPDVLLAKKWEREKNDPVGWWISEKLDGVRAYWHAEKQVFLSRLGNVYPAPDWFTKGFPTDHDLDGELFGGRGRFQFTVGIAKTENSKHWDQLVYKVFDVPTLKQKPFEDRMKHAQKLIADTNSKSIEWVEHTKCKSMAHLDEVFATIEKLGGEGLMIREPKSKYTGGRASSLLKIKSFHDGEAEVIAHEDGKGKYTGMCGALRCKMASGKMFKCASGLSDEQREHPPAVGTIIVYKCQELTNDGIPRFPVFLGVAADKTKPTDPIIANAVRTDE